MFKATEMQMCVSRLMMPAVWIHLEQAHTTLFHDRHTTNWKVPACAVYMLQSLKFSGLVEVE
jgi:hypothetical protein